MDKVTAGNKSLVGERRHNARLRSIFPDARTRVAHCFHGSRDWVDGTLEYLAQRVVHEGFPDINAAEIHMLIKAIERQMVGEARQYLAQLRPHEAISSAPVLGPRDGQRRCSLRQPERPPRQWAQRAKITDRLPLIRVLAVAVVEGMSRNPRGQGAFHSPRLRASCRCWPTCFCTSRHGW